MNHDGGDKDRVVDASPRLLDAELNLGASFWVKFEPDYLSYIKNLLNIYMKTIALHVLPHDGGPDGDEDI